MDQTNNELSLGISSPAEPRHPPTDGTGSDHSASLKTQDQYLPKIGAIVEGTVIAKEPATVFVDLGIFGTGIIFGREFLIARNFIKDIQQGSTMKAKVIEIDNEDGYIELSLEEAGREMVWQRLRQKFESGEPFPVLIRGANKGGLMADVENVAAFLPVSQLSVENYPRVEGSDKTRIMQELQKFINKTMTVKIISLNPMEENLILSEREAVQETLKERLAQYHVGDVVTGTVSGVVDFGVFVRFGEDKSLEGLAHISELDWQLIEDPRKLFDVGQEIKAKIIGIANNKVSLSFKALKKDPWDEATKHLVRGETLEGMVTKFNPFGAFVEIAPGVQGLVHIAEFRTVPKMQEELKLGQKYNFRIALVEPHEHRLGLKLIRDHEEEPVEEVQAVTEVPTEEKTKQTEEPSKTEA